jgi:hypothetical protein
MKTAISIPDIVFKNGESLAHKLGMSRSELYTKAITEFVDAHSEKAVTEKLNDLYSAETSALGDDIYKMQYHGLKVSDEQW